MCIGNLKCKDTDVTEHIQNGIEYYVLNYGVGIKTGMVRIRQDS